MKRREFLAASVATVASALWPLAAGAQQADKVFRIGVFSGSINVATGAAQCNHDSGRRRNA
jgi:hypothetical protein